MLSSLQVIQRSIRASKAAHRHTDAIRVTEREFRLLLLHLRWHVELIGILVSAGWQPETGRRGISIAEFLDADQDGTLSYREIFALLQAGSPKGRPPESPTWGRSASRGRM